MEQWLIVGINGITNGGKTTLASKLENYFLERRGQEIKTGIEINRVELINQDDYFREIDDPKHQKIEKLNHLNWEIIDAINTDRLIDDIMKIVGKNFVLYNTQSKSLHVDHENLFAHHYATNYNSMLKYNNELMLNNDDGNHLNYKHVKHNFLLNILIIEGFLIFNHPVTFDICNIKFHLHVPYEVCFERRKKREYNPPDVLGYFEMVVWPEYERNLQNFKHRKDVTFLNGQASPEKCFDFVLNSLINEL
ncbi:hypothetical protein PVAND_007884 [Polypedilum vanderplanki]|uniref:Nicotinamide riboside kinase n=1 Tax=Polypedilum vanderplanki TaxID=319348 RepID=A0A9J6C887_POLVA|nr:hypothetical protein PVAND_007884 [Polypedilum vanderplanki]